ncbi:MAG: heme-binding protein [Alphaproteobacteria bacterium]|nr:heme-binding protein [Alphaproteobacteria bacterium]
MRRLRGAAAILALVTGACGDGGGGSSGTPTAVTPTPSPPPPPAANYAVPAQEALSQADVESVLARAINEAQGRSLPATIAVTDRVGNVLAVFAMAGANPRLAVPLAPDGSAHDLQGVDVPGAAAGAIAKAITGAYLSSGGNAFSTRTASMIVQANFPPSSATVGLESGPLFGVQFSQLPCSDVAARFNNNVGAGGFIGPKRSPLGLAADPGGFPLYKNGVLVGGVGVMADGVYGFDPEVQDVDKDGEEAIAFAAAAGLAPPDDIRADRITVDGTLLRYADVELAGLARAPASAPPFASLAGSGALVTVRGYYDATGGIVAGRAYGSETSGVRASTAAEFSNPDAFVLTNGAGANRFPIRPGTDGLLAAGDVTALLEEAFKIMTAARGQIRHPLDSRAQVSMAVVDTNGAVLGLVRAPDAPMFGIDVSVQKARTAAFFSNPGAAAALGVSADPEVRAFYAAAQPLFTANWAFSDRAIGNIHRPHFPDGEAAQPPGPLSRSIGQFNPFSTGLQTALVQAEVKAHVGFVLGTGGDVPAQCAAAAGSARLANGMQIFPGSVPIYRGATLVGAIGISGDGIDQDDMTAFLGTNNAGVRLGTLGNADPARRSDRIQLQVGAVSARLRYVNCPFAPFLGTSEQNVCEGK